MAKYDSVTDRPASSPTRPAVAIGDYAPRTAQAITCVVIGGFFLIALSYAVSNRLSDLGLAVFVLTLCTLLGLQLFHSFPALVPRLTPHRRATIALQALLTYIPFFYFGDAWLGMPGFLAGSALLVLPTAAGWTVFGLVIAAAGPIQWLVGYSLADLAYNVVAVVLTAFIVSGLSRMSDLVSELQLARSELANAAITRERLRFARDLHDLLGYSISTITLKCELAYRMVPRQPSQAQEELTEILQISRQALADVRTLASGYRAMSLRAEALSVQAMLNSVGINAEVSIPVSLELPQNVDTVLATVLREGVTNMLRHSKAQRCTIAASVKDGLVRLRLANDGLRHSGLHHSGLHHHDPHHDDLHHDDPHHDDAGEDGLGHDDVDASASGTRNPTSGSGIGNLTARLEELGGTISARRAGNGWFLLHAEVALSGRAAAGPVSG